MCKPSRKGTTITDKISPGCMDEYSIVFGMVIEHGRLQSLATTYVSPSKQLQQTSDKVEYLQTLIWDRALTVWLRILESQLRLRRAA